MKLYRVNSAFPYFVGTQAEAKRDARGCKCDYELVEVPTDKPGLIAYLNSHDAGGTEPTVTISGEPLDTGIDVGPGSGNTPEDQRRDVGGSYTEQSIALDQQWEKLSLARKLDFAAKAMEAAREILP